MDGTTYYAIGDVHGEAALLAALIAQILQDADGKPAHIILLGDLIDRGPDSRGAVDLVMSLQRDPPTRARVTALKGNHEAMMLDALSAPGSSKPKLWLRNGGRETLASYGISEHAAAEVWRDALPSEHVAWFSALPHEHADAERRLLFVHAGIDPHTYPDCDTERRLWTRSADFFDCARWPARPELEGLTVIHGHTPLRVPVPEIAASRINVDTGACSGGPLSAVKLAPGREVEILQAYRRSAASELPDA